MNINPSLLSFIARSKRRQEVLQNIKEGSTSQPELRKITGMYKAHTSRTLLELSKRKLIICMNPKDRAFKFYKITSLGKKVLSKVEKILSFSK